MKASLANGSPFWNAGEIYGTPSFNSLHLLNRYFTKYPEDASKVFLSIKGGYNHQKFQPDGSAEGIKTSIENCLKGLEGKKTIDIFECARVDKNTEIEVTMGELKKHLDAGSIGGVALSEVGAKTIERAVRVVKICAVEVEFSLFSCECLYLFTILGSGRGAKLQSQKFRY